MEEMRDGRMDGSKDGWKVVRLALRGGDRPTWLSPGTLIRGGLAGSLLATMTALTPPLWVPWAPLSPSFGPLGGLTSSPALPKHSRHRFRDPCNPSSTPKTSHFDTPRTPLSVPGSLLWTTWRANGLTTLRTLLTPLCDLHRPPNL